MLNSNAQDFGYEMNQINIDDRENNINNNLSQVNSKQPLFSMVELLNIFYIFLLCYYIVERIHSNESKLRNNQSTSKIIINL